MGSTRFLEAHAALRAAALRTLSPGTFAQLRMVDLRTGADDVLLQVPQMIEAPNWDPGGQFLIVNGSGTLFRVSLDRPSLEPISVTGIDDANNDHVISPDGTTSYISAAGAVFAVPVTGGDPRLLTPSTNAFHFLHGISPDGGELSLTTIEPAGSHTIWAVDLLPVTGGMPRRLLESGVALDGPEWSPDGQWIWFNGELGAQIGHARLFRIRLDGSGLEQMTDSEYVDWFPHLSPDGGSVAFLRYDPGTIGHPADRDVTIHVMPAGGGDAREIAALRGGQGTINVNSWRPDSVALAYIAYPTADARSTGEHAHGPE